MLLKHHEVLALQHRVAMLLVHQLGRGDIGKAAPQIEIRQHGRRLVHALIVLRARSAPEGETKTPVPTFAGGKTRRGGIIENADAIDRPIDYATFHAHDEWNRLALDRGRHGDVSRLRPFRIECLVSAAVRRLVEPVIARRRRAVGVGRLTQTRLLRTALIRRHMRTGEDRARDRIIHQRLADRIAGRPAHLQPVAAIIEPGDHAPQRVGWLVELQRGFQLPAIERNLQLARLRAFACLDLDKRIAARHEIVARRQNLDVDLSLNRRRCRLRQRRCRYKRHHSHRSRGASRKRTHPEFDHCFSPAGTAVR